MLDDTCGSLVDVGNNDAVVDVDIEEDVFSMEDWITPEMTGKYLSQSSSEISHGFFVDCTGSEGGSDVLSVRTDCITEELAGSSDGSILFSFGTEGLDVAGNDTEVLDCGEVCAGEYEFLVDTADVVGDVDAGVFVILCFEVFKDMVLFDVVSTGTSFLTRDDIVSAAAATTAHPARTILVYFAAIPIFFIFMTIPPNMTKIK